MTEEVSHASSNLSPNTLSIVNIVCLFMCLRGSMCLSVQRASEKNIENDHSAGTDRSE